MTETRQVAFSESRQIRRKGETVKWWAGKTYDYDPDMDPMIEIGHARFVGEAKEEPAIIVEQHVVGSSDVVQMKGRRARNA